LFYLQGFAQSFLAPRPATIEYPLFTELARVLGGAQLLDEEKSEERMLKNSEVGLQ
jgi:hypothetical protein